MPDGSKEESGVVSSVFQYNVTAQLDMLIFLVALIGAGVTIQSFMAAFAGIVCLGIAAITLFRLYRTEYR